MLNAFACEHDPSCVADNSQNETKAPVRDVECLHAQLRSFSRSQHPELPAHARKSSDPGPNAYVETVVRQMLVSGKILRYLRPRSDQAHVVDDDIPQLWPFIKMILAQEPTHGGHPRVIRYRLFPPRFRTYFHCAEFVD